MRYNIMVVSDIHWGVIAPKEQVKSLEFIFEYIEQTKDDDKLRPDLLVIAGDYFDTKLPLNSREAITAIQWFHRLYKVCKEYDIVIRLFQGTLDHDNDQLDVFKPLERGNFFKVFINTTMEETLPGLKCIYCPDETIPTSEYEEKYLNEILEEKDIAFFHGSFDLVYGDLYEVIMKDMIKKNTQNVIYRYNMWSPQIRGPLISGHWHDGKKYNELYYSGSPFRWTFGEDEPKGFLTINYDTEDYSYLVHKVINPLCAEYLTYEVYSNTFNTKEDYIKIVDYVRSVLERLNDSSLNNKLRIKIYKVDDKIENDSFITALRQEVINYKNCKITIKDKIKDKKRKEKLEEHKDNNDTVDYIFDKSNRYSTIISRYIRDNFENGIDIPLEYIEEKIKKYI